MVFEAFLAYLAASVLVSAALHYGAKLYVVPGTWSFVSKCVVGYLGAFWGQQFFGNWGPAFGGVHFVPALLGAAALLIVLIDLVKIWLERSS